ncbi:hypothetical protein Theam_1787 (plasmid) [Thermovibrio ammonificans HB-1]|uniref:TraK C-terminal domain-containing protein n=1 Tax=Thermovibrio ammonificans (strain DSM 15698 / JCM 12110 / HB-1) TaxID=648996 RepID=E8T6S0_THEA1|nr:type-F conjugative transfer system secretin TraK [Thermovibrio ammonificans]ADU97743.1 hypothetical protein Theam_1787 [Thermovibrio ammonificans HB-1]
MKTGVVAAATVLSLIVLPVQALAQSVQPVERVVLTRQNQVLFLRAEFNRPVTVKFPYPVSYAVPQDSRIDVQAGNDFVILKVIDDSVKTAVLSVVLNKNGKPLVIPVQVELVKKGAPLKVVVVDGQRELSKVERTATLLIKESVQRASRTPVAELIAAMIRHTEFPKEAKPLPGYTVVSYGPEGKLLKSFSSNNLLEARLLYEYRSPVRTGVVIKLINRSIYPLTISEEDFATDGVLAVSLSRRRLAPRPYTATEKLSGDYTAYLYLVIRGDKWQR